MLRERFVFLGFLMVVVLAGAVQPVIAGSQAHTVTINAGKTFEPISKFIYGQFIEHLGRCIYGGIWAEMLEDRKFYFPITPEYDPYRGTRNVSKDSPFAVVGASPWQITGAPDSVAMSDGTRRSFSPAAVSGSSTWDWSRTRNTSAISTSNHKAEEQT